MVKIVLVSGGVDSAYILGELCENLKNGDVIIPAHVSSPNILNNDIQKTACDEVLKYFEDKFKINLRNKLITLEMCIHNPIKDIGMFVSAQEYMWFAASMLCMNMTNPNKEYEVYFGHNTDDDCEFKKYTEELSAVMSKIANTKISIKYMLIEDNKSKKDTLLDLLMKHRHLLPKCIMGDLSSKQTDIYCNDILEVVALSMFLDEDRTQQILDDIVDYINRFTEYKNAMQRKINAAKELNRHIIPLSLCK